MMGEIVELIYSFLQGFFEFNSDDSTSKKIKKVIFATLIFLILIIILVVYIYLVNQPENVTTIYR